MTPTAFRVSVLCSLSNEDYSWPVVEWKAGDDTEVLAMFHFDSSHPPGACSWLVHYGSGILKDSTNDTRWKKTALAWGVTDMTHLKTLFGAAQHFLGILEWSPVDAMNLYCSADTTNCSAEEYYC
jgi:hypothetical protein